MITANAKVSAVKPLSPEIHDAQQPTPPPYCVGKLMASTEYEPESVEILAQTENGEFKRLIARCFFGRTAAERYANAAMIIKAVNFCAGVDLARLKVDCDQPDLTLASLICDGDALVDEILRDEQTIRRLREALKETVERYDSLDKRLVVGQHCEPNGTISRALAALEETKPALDDEAQFLKECKL